MRNTKVLAIFANPKGSDLLRLSAEDRVINECLARSKYRENVTLHVRHAATIHDVRRALLDEDYRIVHFSGHGTGKGLVLENELGELQLIPQEALAELLSAYSSSIECVILNACYSDIQGKLVSLGVPYSIAMNGPISDESAIEFTRGFYDAIGAGKDIEFAYQEGCRTIKLTGLPDGSIPIILKKPEDKSSTTTASVQISITHPTIEKYPGDVSLSQLGLSVSKLEYFCYVSENKVNQLYAQLPDQCAESALNLQDAKRIVALRKEIALARDKTTESIHTLVRELEELETRRNLMLLRFGKGSATRLPGLVGLDTLLPKFRTVLRHILTSKKVARLKTVAENHSHLNAFCYIYSGLFHFEEFASREMAIVASRMHNYELRLYCSMKYFSDMGGHQDANGEWYATPHSMNFAFFSDEKPEYYFKSLFFITSVKEQLILGSPLYLILNSREDISL